MRIGIIPFGENECQGNLKYFCGLRAVKIFQRECRECANFNTAYLRHLPIGVIRVKFTRRKRNLVDGGATALSTSRDQKLL